jgi:gluconolactonase
MYPSDSDVFVAHDGAFREVTGDHPRLEKLIDVDAHEGPVYARAEDALYFTSVPTRGDIPAPRTPSVAIRRLQLDGLKFPRSASDVCTVRDAANMANGMALDSDGRRLLVCEQGTRFEHGAITRFDPHTQGVETLVDHWRGLRLNSPNDVVQKPGAVNFTFGGVDDNILFITADTAIYAVCLRAVGR